MTDGRAMTESVAALSSKELSHLEPTRHALDTFWNTAEDLHKQTCRAMFASLVASALGVAQDSSAPSVPRKPQAPPSESPQSVPKPSGFC